MERRELAESALKHLCESIGVRYGTEGTFDQGAWFLDTITRNKVNIAQWSEGSRKGGRSVHMPLGSYGENLTHEQVYDRCWFADRCFTAREESQREANVP
jgi:hypothetical protein